MAAEPTNYLQLLLVAIFELIVLFFSFIEFCLIHRCPKKLMFSLSLNHHTSNFWLMYQYFFTISDCVFYVKTTTASQWFEIPISIFIAVVFLLRSHREKNLTFIPSNEMSLTAVKTPNFLLRFFTDMIFLGSKLIALGLLNP
jgi:hypothetical protein